MSFIRKPRSIVNNIRNDMLARTAILMQHIHLSKPLLDKDMWAKATNLNTSYGANRKAHSSFKQNRRLQIKTGNFKSRY